MKIIVISDIHENFHNLILALKLAHELKADQLICLGDLMNAGIAKVIAMQEIPCYMIWGNNDGEKIDVLNASNAEGSNLTISNNSYDFLEFDKKKIFISHYDNLAIPMAKSGLYDAVFYGHNHLKKKERIDYTWVVNPGEISAQKTGTASIALYDTATNEVELIDLENTITLKSDMVSEYLQENAEKLNFRSAKSFGIKK